MKDNIFKFGDFLNEDKFNKISKKKYSVLESEEKEEEIEEYSNETEESSEEEETSIYESFMADNIEDSEESEEDSYEDSEQEIDYEPSYEKIEEEEEEVTEEEFLDESKNENFYNLYADKSENFICDISIQGADPKQTQARLVVESGDWTLMFYGELKGGKCIIPLKKLSILKEGQVGDIRLEVIAEGNLFVPWEDKFKVKVSKKVTVKVNEQKSSYRNSSKKDFGVKVKVKR
jgi:hypothetical protein